MKPESNFPKYLSVSGENTDNPVSNPLEESGVYGTLIEAERLDLENSLHSQNNDLTLDRVRAWGDEAAA